MLIIRLRRVGKKNDPFYRIVITEKTAPIQGKFLKQIGHYNPQTKALVLDKDEAMNWMNKGAKPSNTVAKLMKREKMDHKSIVIHKTRSISKKEMEEIKAREEADRAKEQAEKEAAKEAWEKEAAEKAAEAPSSDEKLVDQAEEIIQEEKAVEEDKADKETTVPETEETPKENPDDSNKDKLSQQPTETTTDKEKPKEDPDKTDKENKK